MSEAKEITLVYSNKEHFIDVNTLVPTLSHFSALLCEVNKELNPEHKLSINVKGFEAGSFDVVLKIAGYVIPILGYVAGAENGIAIIDTISTVIELLKLKMSLKGKKPQSVIEGVEDTVIVNGNNNNVTVNKKTLNIYVNDTSINENMAQFFKKVSGDPSIDSFSIKSEDNIELVAVNREEYEGMTEPNECLKLRETKERSYSENNVQLTIVKVVFEEGRKWEFLYGQSKISATIKDATFLAKVNEGEQFSKGDILEVDLCINQVFDDFSQSYENRNFIIEHVHGHQLRGKQMFLGEV